VPKLKHSADSYQENLLETTKMYIKFLLINDTSICICWWML